MIQDFSYRLSSNHNSHPLINSISRNYIELSCYIFFSVEFFFGVIAMGGIFERGSYLSDRWRLFYSIILIISWTTYLPDNSLLEICLCIRLLGPIRILNLFEPLKENLNSFIKALTAVYKVFLSIFVIMFFYALVGMYLFYGLEENRCRETALPEHNVWIMGEETEFCGNWHCHQGFIELIPYILIYF